MRKFIYTAALLLFCAAAGYAQDLIHLCMGDTIQATVTEVSQSLIKYKKFTNPNGPTYTIRSIEVDRIVYANGDEDIFGCRRLQEREMFSPPPPDKGFVDDYNLQRRPAERANARQARPYYPRPYEDGYCIPEDLPANQVRNFVHEIPEAARAFNSGRGMKIGGNILMGFGIGFCATGLLIHLATVDSHGAAEINAVGLFYDLMGVAFIVPGTILKGKGNEKIKQSISIYNDLVCPSYGSLKPATKLSFGLSPSGGLGLALNF